MLAAEVVERLGDDADALVLPHTRTQEGVQLVVGGVHHRCGRHQKGNLVFGLGAASLQEGLLAVDDPDSFCRQRLQNGHLGHVQPHRLGGQAEAVQFAFDRAGHLLGPARLGVERPSKGRDPGAGTGLRTVPIVQPRVVHHVVLGRRTEVPDHRLPSPGQQGETDQLVDGPGPDVGGGHIPDVVEVERQQRPQVAAFELAPQPGHPVVAQAVEVHPLLPVDGVEAKTLQNHVWSLSFVSERFVAERCGPAGAGLCSCNL